MQPLSSCDSSVVVHTPPPTSAPTSAGGFFTQVGRDIEDVGEDILGGIEDVFDDVASFVESAFSDVMTAVQTIETLMKVVAEAAVFVEDLIQHDGDGSLDGAP
jgi:hypothetical protein